MKYTGMIAAVAGLAFAAPAMAVDLKFTIVGDYTASFVLPSSPSPDVAFDGSYFTIFDVPGFDDAAFGVADLDFYNQAIGGGIGIRDFYRNVDLLLTDGPQLYSGPESSPTFLLGSYALTDYFGSGDTYTLTISSLSATVPEPASWAMMIAGMGMAGAALRRRRKLTVTYASA